MLVRAKLIASVLVIVGSLALLSAAGVSARAQLPASATAGGKIRAHLSKKSLSAAEARSVKLVYRFKPTSKRFTYQLFRQSGSKWVKLRAVARKGRFTGSHTKTLKSIFGSKSVTAALATASIFAPTPIACGSASRLSRAVLPTLRSPPSRQKP